MADKTNMDRLFEVAGFEPKEGRENFLKGIKDNIGLLNACKLHNFGRIAGFQRKLKCKNCGGVMDTSKAVAYAKGYKAAGKDINDIIQGV